MESKPDIKAELPRPQPMPFDFMQFFGQNLQQQAQLQHPFAYLQHLATTATPSGPPPTNLVNPYFPIMPNGINPSTVLSAFRSTVGYANDTNGLISDYKPIVNPTMIPDDRDSGNETSSISPSHTPLTTSPAASLPSR